MDSERRPILGADKHLRSQSTSNAPATCGIETDRSCRDVFFLLLYVAFWIGMLVIAGFAFTKGNPARLLYGVDSRGNLCGYDNSNIDGSLPNLRGYKNLLSFVDEIGATRSLCVVSCPTLTATASMSQFNCYYSYNVNDTTTLYNGIANGICAPGVFESRARFHRCIPSKLDDSFTDPVNGAVHTAASLTQNVYGRLDATELGQRVLSDMSIAYPWIFLLAGIAVVVSFLWTLLVRHMAGCMVWASIATAVALSIASTGFIFIKYHDESKEIHSGKDGTSADKSNRDTLLAMGIVMAVFTVILIAFIYMARRRIELAIAVVKETAVAMYFLPQLILVPFASFIAYSALFAYWVGVMLFLGSTGKAQLSVVNDIPMLIYEEDKTLRNMQLYHLFGLLWALGFISAIVRTTVAGAFGTYYWTRDKEFMTPWVISTSFARTVHYHLGSLALGSLLVALVQTVRFFVESLRRQLADSSSTLAKFAFACVQCCFSIIEAIIRFINKNAYVMIALHGKSFCTSAKRGFDLFERNAFRMIAVNWVADLVMFMGKAVITLVASMIAVAIFEPMNNMSYYAVPVLVVGLLAYCISSAFMGLYSVGTDTIFICYCEDAELNDGSSARPYFMSGSLRDIMGFTSDAEQHSDGDGGV